MIEVIAEIANSHQGKISIAKKIINNFKNSGSSSIKFQIYFADEFMSKNHSRFKHFKKQGFSHDQLKDLFNYSRKLGYNKIYADVLGFKAFEIARSLKVDGYKIHSTDLMNLDLLKKVSKEKKKVFLSVGGAKHPEIYKAVKIFNLQKIKPVLMHGYQSYPTKVEDTNLKYIAELKRLYKDSCYYGFQDHISGSSKYNLYVCLASIGFGINYI